METFHSEPLISVEQYLNTSYNPDVEFVDGALVERNAGDWPPTLVEIESQIVSTIDCSLELSTDEISAA